MEMDRNIERLMDAKEMVSVGMISGAVGTFANIDPRVEEKSLRPSGIKAGTCFHSDYSTGSSCRFPYNHCCFRCES